MTSPDSPDIGALVNAGRESANFEFKQSAPWDDLKLGLIRTVLGMTNTEGGGHIVVGVTEDDGAFSPAGMTDEHIASFPSEDKFQAAVNGFAQPFVSPQLDEREHEGRRFLVVSVSEFEDVPVVCKRSEGTKLRGRALYVRSGRMPETVEISDPSDQQSLFRLVANKAGTSNAMTLDEARRELRRRLDACEREWTNQVVPTEAKRFYERFPALHTSPSISMSDDDWEESLRIHLPAFLPPWQRVEELGLHVIREGPAFDSVLPELMLALERAYTLCDRIRPQQPNTITGHGALLALRTWTLWGAVALDCENWVAVEALLHRPTNIGPNYPPLTQLHLHYPAATGNRIDIAARSVEDQLTPLAAQQFGDVESMRAFIGFWRFTVDFATRGGDEWLLQVLAAAPRNRFEGLVARLGTDRDYASHFAEAVSQTSLATLEQVWREGLRDRLLDRRKLGIERRHWDLPRLPDSIGGVGPPRGPIFMSPRRR